MLTFLSPAIPSVARSAKSAECGALIARLSVLSKLSAEEVHLLKGLGRFTKQHGARTELSAGEERFKPRILISGWASQQRLLSDGRRQIINFLLPGDIVGSLEQFSSALDCESVALTSVVTADASTLTTTIEKGDFRREGLARALRLMAQQETALMRDQIVRLGRQTAYERLVHLMLELHCRLQAAGLATEYDFAMPLTQDILADSLGLSIVHVNRTLQQARRDGLLEIRSGQVKIIDLKLMQTVADWAPPVVNKTPALPAELRNIGKAW